MKQWMQKRFGKIFICNLILIFCLLFGQAVQAQQRNVRVGLFPMAMLVHDDTIEELTVYERDYLRELAKYAPWQYEYIYYPGWQKAAEALRNGEIDLIGFAQKTKERSGFFAFSEYESGTTYEALLTDRDAPVVFEDSQAFAGKRVGVLKEYICMNELKKYMEEQQFQAELIQYDSMQEMSRDLRDHKIDLLAANIDDRTEWEKVVGRFAPSPFFYVTNARNRELLEELNYAEAEVRRRTPEFLLRLNETHFPRREKIFLSRSDLNFIESQKVITIGMLAQRPPLYFYDTASGRMQGILVDLLDQISNHTGLTFQYVPIFNESPMVFLQEKKADIVAGMVEPRENNKDVVFSEVLLQGQLGMIGRAGEAFDQGRDITIVVPKSYTVCQDYVRRAYPNAKLVLCDDDTISGLNMVKEGQADFMMQNSYVLTKALQLPVYRDLTVVPTISVPEDIRIVMLAESDPRLLSVLNKSIVSISADYSNQSIIAHMMRNNTLSIKDLFMGYRFQILIFCGLLLVIAAAALYIFQMRHRHLHQIERREQILKNITNNITGGVITVVADEKFTITYANDGFIDLIGYDKKDYKAQQKQNGLYYVYEEDRPLLRQLLDQKGKEENIEFEFRIIRKDRSIVPVLFRGTASRDEHGALFYYCVVIDISLQKGMLHQLEIEKERYRIITEQSEAVIFEIDFVTNTIGVSTKFVEQFGCDVSGELPLQEIHPDDVKISKIFRHKLLEGSAFAKEELRIKRADGTYLWCEAQASPIWEGGDVTGAIGKITNIDKEKKEREKLRTLAEKDSLTGLYNKTTAYALIESYIAGVGKHEGALLFIDIDHFKSVNDYLGHMKGDEVLLEIADKLRRIFCSSDIIGRFGGDEFCVFTDRNALAERAEELRAQICKKFMHEQGEIQISSSIGIALYPQDARGLAELVKKADQALYAAKERGKNQVIFYEEGLVLKGYKSGRS